MNTTALDNILEAFDKMDLFSFKKYVDENRGILTHKNKQKIIDAYNTGGNESIMDFDSKRYFDQTFTTNKETLK